MPSNNLACHSARARHVFLCGWSEVLGARFRARFVFHHRIATCTDRNFESKVVAQTNSTLLTISVIAVLLPGAFVMVQQATDTNISDEILKMSHGVCLPISK